MQEEKRRKSVVLEYFHRLNAGDERGVLELLAENVRIEDPIGAPPRTDRPAARDYVTGQIRAGVRIAPGTLVASHDDEQVAAPYTATAPDGTTRMLGLFRIGDGRITELRAFWGRTDRVGAVHG